LVFASASSLRGRAILLEINVIFATSNKIAGRVGLNEKQMVVKRQIHGCPPVIGIFEGAQHGPKLKMQDA
jgi:hypothetical protein